MVTAQQISINILFILCRQFLWSFRLPGEAQKIDRMMECFARRYCELNPGVFTTTGNWQPQREYTLPDCTNVQISWFYILHVATSNWLIFLLYRLLNYEYIYNFSQTFRCRNFTYCVFNALTLMIESKSVLFYLWYVAAYNCGSCLKGLMAETFERLIGYIHCSVYLFVYLVFTCCSLQIRVTFSRSL